MPTATFFRDTKTLWRYRLTSDNGEIFHATHRGWNNVDDARLNFWSLGQALVGLGLDIVGSYQQGMLEAHGAELSSYKDARDEYRWRLVLKIAKTPIMLGHAHEGFSSTSALDGNLLALRRFYQAEYNVEVERAG